MYARLILVFVKQSGIDHGDGEDMLNLPSLEIASWRALSQTIVTFNVFIS